MKRCQLPDSHGARFIQPAQIRGQIGNRRLHQDPRGRFVYVSQALQHVGVGIRRRPLEQVAEIRIRLDIVTAYECGGASKHRLVRGIATDNGEERELLQCVGK